MERFQKGGIAALPSSCTLKIRYEGLSDYFLKCCLGGLSTGHGADPLHRQMSVCFYTSWKTGPSASHLPNTHRCRTSDCSPPEQVHPLSTSGVFLCTQWISALGLALFQLHFIENRRWFLAVTLSWTLLCVQLDLLLTLLDVITRIVAFVPNSLFVGPFCIEITVKPFSMVFSPQSEKCVKAVEGHIYYNKTKERNNRASILKSSGIQHIIGLVISVWIRRVAKGRRHLNPAAPLSIHNEKNAGVLFPSLFLPLWVMCLEWSLENMPLCQGNTEENVQFVGICSSTPQLLSSFACQARLWPLQSPKSHFNYANIPTGDPWPQTY